jgi:hypothetical protein
MINKEKIEDKNKRNNLFSKNNLYLNDYFCYMEGDKIFSNYISYKYITENRYKFNTKKYIYVK